MKRWKHVAAALTAAVAMALGLSGGAAEAATGKYLIVGTNVGPASNGQIFELTPSGLAVTGVPLALPVGPTNSSFPVYNSGSGLLMYGGSRPGTVGVFNLEDHIDALPAPVSTVAYGLGGLFDSEWAADPASGKFLSAVRGGPSTMVTFDPGTLSFSSGATHTMGIPESTWIYNGFVWSSEEGAGNVWRTPLLGGGTTAGPMALQFALGSNGVPNSQGGYNEYATAVSFSDGVTLFGNYSKNLYLFDLDLMPGAAVTTIDLFTQLTTSAGGFTAVDGYVTGVVLDPLTDLFYVTGVFRNAGATQERDYLIAVSKTGVVTPLLQEINGDVIVTGSGYGLGFANFAGPPIPEPGTAAMGLIAAGLLMRRSRCPRR